MGRMVTLRTGGLIVLLSVYVSNHAMLRRYQPANPDAARGGVLSPSYNFSQVFDGAAGNVSGGTTVPGEGDRPPPEDSWLSDGNSDGPFNDGTIPSIPRIVNKIFFRGESGFPPAADASSELAAAHRSWSEMNPGYEVRYFDLDLARRYLHRHFHPAFLRAFDCLQAFAGKSDLFRMALLYREGGWHSDWEQVCLGRNALRDISGATGFFGVWAPFTSADYHRHRCVHNGLVGARPRHPIVARVLELILNHTQRWHYGPAAYDPSGVCALGLAVLRDDGEDGAWFRSNAGSDVGDYNWKWNGTIIAKHRCDGCTDQDGGNDQEAMWKRRRMYCEDAGALFRE